MSAFDVFLFVYFFVFLPEAKKRRRKASGRSVESPREFAPIWLNGYIRDIIKFSNIDDHYTISTGGTGNLTDLISALSYYGRINHYHSLGKNIQQSYNS